MKLLIKGWKTKQVVLVVSAALAALVLAWSVPNVNANTITWNVAGAGNWGTAGNWSPATVPGINDDAIFPAINVSGPTSINLGGTQSIANITSTSFDNGGIQPFYLITGGTLNLAPNATILAQGSAFFALTFDGSCVLNLQGGASFIAQSVNIRVSGLIQGSGPVNFIAENGVFLFLDGANTYTGGTVLSTTNPASRIVLDGANNFSTGTVTVAETGAGLFTISPSTLSNDFRLDGNLIVDPQIQSGVDDSLTFNGPISGSGGLIKLNAGTLILNNVNTYTGGTVINEGMVLLGVDNAITGAVSLADVASAQLNMNNHNLTISSLNGGGPNGGNVLLGSGFLTITGSGDYEGNISGSGGVIKSGSGTQILSGENTYTGGTVVQGGGLFVTGSILGDAVVQPSGILAVSGSVAGNVAVAPQGALLGTGKIGGSVFNAGVLEPGLPDVVGTLTIAGNYAQASTGSFLLQVSGPDTASHLVVGGGAALSGSLVVVPIDSFDLILGTTYEFLTAGGGITGTFDSIIMPEGFRGRLLDSPTTLSILIAPASYTLLAQTQNQFNVAQALDTFIPATGGDEKVVSTALDELSAEHYPAAFDQIAPTYYESLAEIQIERSNMQGQQMQMRFGAIRLGGRGFSMRGLEAPLLVEKSMVDYKDYKEGKNILEPVPDNHWGVWIQGNGIFATNHSVNNVPTFRFDSGGFLTGVDYLWGAGLATGVYGGYQGTYATYDRGARTTINSALFGLYATYDMPDTGFYVDSLIGGSYSNYNVRRPIQFGTIDRTATSRPSGGELLTLLGLGYDWQLGNFTFGPTFTGQYTYVGIAPFSESGADSLNLRIGQQNANSLRTFLGGRVAYTWKATENFFIIPEGRMVWQHEYLEYPRTIEAGLNNGAGAPFSYQTASPSRDAVLASAGLIFQIGPHWNTNFYYTADFGRNDFVGHAISGSLNTEF